MSRDQEASRRKGERSPFSRLPSLRLGVVIAALTVIGLFASATNSSNSSIPAIPESSQVVDDEESTTSTTSDETSTAETATPASPVLVAGVSIPPLADLVRRVGGDRVEVISVVPQGVDGHTYEPRPSDVVDLSRLDVKFFASRDLNPAVTRVVDANLPKSAVMIDLMAVTLTDGELISDVSHSHGSGGSHSHANVHVWTDPTIAMRWVNVIREQLTKIDPSGAGLYRVNAATVIEQLQTLHEAIVAATATVPAEFRTLVVYHDSWSYFGRTYGFRVLGALQAADFAEPSAREIRNMVEQVRGAGVPSFFGAAVFPTEVLRRVSDESGVPYVADLADDELPGAPGDPHHSYVGMMVENARHIVRSLGGDAAALDLVPL